MTAADISFETTLTTFPDAYIGVVYQAGVPYYGNAAVLNAVSITAGALPAGLNMKSTTTRPTIVGTPTTANTPGTYTFTVSLNDSTTAVTKQYTMLLHDTAQLPEHQTEEPGEDVEAADADAEWPVVQ